VTVGEVGGETVSRGIGGDRKCSSAIGCRADRTTAAAAAAAVTSVVRFRSPRV